MEALGHHIAVAGVVQVKPAILLYDTGCPILAPALHLTDDPLKMPLVKGRRGRIGLHAVMGGDIEVVSAPVLKYKRIRLSAAIAVFKSQLHTHSS
jgi:hypothetical protein